MSEYKLHYFPLHGKGDPIRMLLSHSGTKYDNEVISFLSWYGPFSPKKTFPGGGGIPCLELRDGTRMG